MIRRMFIIIGATASQSQTLFPPVCVNGHITKGANRKGFFVYWSALIFNLLCAFYRSDVV